MTGSTGDKQDFGAELQRPIGSSKRLREALERLSRGYSDHPGRWPHEAPGAVRFNPGVPSWSRRRAQCIRNGEPIAVPIEDPLCPPQGVCSLLRDDDGVTMSSIAGREQRLATDSVELFKFTGSGVKVSRMLKAAADAQLVAPQYMTAAKESKGGKR